MIKRILLTLLFATLLPSLANATPQPRSILYTYFETGDRPTAAQFRDLIDSFATVAAGAASNYYVDTGAANAYVVTTNPATTLYTDGTALIIKFTHANTGGSTINAGAGAVPLVYMDGTGLSSGTLPTNSIGLVVYTSTSSSFQLVNIIPSSGGSGCGTLTGDVTTAGSGACATTIANNAVTLAKLGTIPANTVITNPTTGAATPTTTALSASQLLGRGSTGNVAPITLGTGLSMSGTTLSSTGGGTGIITVDQQTFTSSGTYTPCAGIAYAIGEAIGSGAGGGASTTGAGGGGGAGGYSRSALTAAQIGASQSITIGAAGAGGSAGGNGGNGGDTSIGSLVIAKGGSFGTGSSTNGAGGAGGVAGTGNVAFVGNGGGYGLLANNTGSGGFATYMGGLGGAGPFGGQPVQVVSTSNLSGNAGHNYGAGGGGGAATASGGAGAKGAVIITEFCTQ